MEPSVSEGGERRGKEGEGEGGEGERKIRGREERREGERRKEGKGGKEVEREDSNNFFPVWSVLHVQYKCKALKILTIGGEGDADNGGERRRGRKETRC